MTLELLGQYIKAERERRNLTLRQLEDKSGVSYSMINKIENGGLQSISVDTLEKLANGLKVDFDELLRIARGLPAERREWSPEAAEAIKILNELPEDRRLRLLELLELQAKMLQE